MTVAIVLLSALFLGLYETFKKVSLKKSSIYEVLFFYCLSGFLCALALTNIHFFDLTFTDALIIFGKSIIIVTDWFIVLLCMKKLDVGIVTSFGLLQTALIVVGSFFVYKEAIGWIHFASFALIGGGCILLAFLSKSQNEDKKSNNYLYLLLLIFACILGASSGLLDKYMMNYRKLSSGVYLTWFLLFNSLIYGVIYLIKNKKLEFRKLYQNYPLIITGALIVISDTLYYKAITMDGAEISLISIIRKTSVIVATLSACLFLKEKNLLKKLGILFIMLIGVALPLIFK